MKQVVQDGARHLIHGGELRIYIGAGERCQHPPKIGSGVIDSDLGRLYVSSLTIRRLSPLLAQAQEPGVSVLREAWRSAAELMADGFEVEWP